MITVNEILSALSVLTQFELEKIRTQATVLISLGGGRPAKLEAQASRSLQDSTDYHAEDLVLRAVCGAVKLANGSFVKPHALRGASSTMATLRQHLPGLMTYIEVVKDEHSRTAFLGVAMALLVDAIREQRITLTPVVVVRHLHRIPAVVDRAFPGYYQAGHLDHIIHIYGGRHGNTSNDDGSPVRESTYTSSS